MGSSCISTSCTTTSSSFCGSSCSQQLQRGCQPDGPGAGEQTRQQQQTHQALGCFPAFALSHHTHVHTLVTHELLLCCVLRVLQLAKDRPDVVRFMSSELQKHIKGLPTLVALQVCTREGASMPHTTLLLVHCGCSPACGAFAPHTLPRCIQALT